LFYKSNSYVHITKFVALIIIIIIIIIIIMWNVKKNVIPVIMGATGTIPKSFRKCVSNIKVKELQKTAILGTAHILRKVLMKRYKIFNAETNDINTMNINNSIAATLYSLGIQFVSGI